MVIRSIIAWEIPNRNALASSEVSGMVKSTVFQYVETLSMGYG
jgi:hypothetical protein